jgi:Dual specificity phosphatase, catalytic domain
VDFDWVTTSLAVGARLNDDAWGRLANELGVRRVVDVRLEACDDAALLSTHGIVLLHLPTQDCCALAPEAIDRGVAWVTGEIARGERVLIHCQHGIGRSALLALCVLVRLGRAPLDAMRALKDARECVSPGPEQLDAFVQFCGRGPAPDAHPPSVDELSRIAWRHLRWD